MISHSKFPSILFHYEHHQMEVSAMLNPNHGMSKKDANAYTPSQRRNSLRELY
jgi:hypothetical protein